MNLGDVKNGRTIFIDTNVLIYARTGQSLQCRQLIGRCRARELNGVISSFVVAEFCHRRMMQEAQSGSRSVSNPARALAQKPETVRGLSLYAEDVRALLSGELTLVETEKTDFSVALEIQRQSGLLTIDSINLAVARRCGINEIATADASFDRIPGLIVCKPNDSFLGAIVAPSPSLGTP
ncbi:MAG: type II toxin-antitoxin system VapC family toxin [Verrucomicrobia bacterium]|nr:type II toxin-antitoxin system VapC family toxin [Verrucomicrobiota bacterium]